MEFTTGPEPRRFTIKRTRTYTDAYGLPQTERVTTRIPVTRQRSLVATQPIAYSHPDYLTGLGNAVAMLQAIHGRQSRSARMYRDAAMRSASVPALVRLTRLWNQATAPRPFLP